jgi:hypothetical protein
LSPGENVSEVFNVETVSAIVGDLREFTLASHCGTCRNHTLLVTNMIMDGGVSFEKGVHVNKNMVFLCT